MKQRGFERVIYADKKIQLPVRGTSKSAGYDFYAPVDIFVPANGRSENTYLDVKAYMQDDEYLQIKIRSSLATKHCLMLETSGVIDADYFSNKDNDGNISVVFRNNSNEDYIIKKGDRCCQGIFMKYLICDDDDATSERAGGFGSTGK